MMTGSADNREGTSQRSERPRRGVLIGGGVAGATLAPRALAARQRRVVTGANYEVTGGDSAKDI